MLAVYILGGLAMYLGVGIKCAKIDIKDSIKNNCDKKLVIKNAVRSLWFWPHWLVTEYPRQLLEKQVERDLEINRLKLESDKEVQKLLDSGELGLDDVEINLDEIEVA